MKDWLNFIEPDDPVVMRVVDRYFDRSRLGIQKYKTTLHDNPADTLTWLQHLQEELMDATLYIERLKDEFKSLKNNNQNG